MLLLPMRDNLVDIVRISTKAKSSLNHTLLKTDDTESAPDMTFESVAGADFVTKFAGNS